MVTRNLSYESDGEREYCETILADRNYRLFQLLQLGTVAFILSGPVLGKLLFAHPLSFSLLTLADSIAFFILGLYRLFPKVFKLTPINFYLLVNSSCFAVWGYLLYLEAQLGASVSSAVLLFAFQGISWLIVFPRHDHILNFAALYLLSLMYVGMSPSTLIWFWVFLPGVFIAWAYNHWSIRDIRSKEILVYRSRRQAVNMLAHDIKRPAHIMRFMVNLIQSEPNPSRISGSLKSLLPDLVTASNSIEGMLNQVLNQKSEETGTAVSIRQILEESRRLTSLPSTIELRYQMNHGKKAKGNVNELVRVFSNLFENAIHAMKGTGVIEISSRSKSNLVEIDFHNTNSYIPPEDQARVFTPGFSKKQSSGLGLSIVKKIISEHQGNISIESSKENGTTFKIALPESDEKEDLSISEKKAFILIDDDLFIHAAWERENPYAVIQHFSNPEEFLRTFKQNPSVLKNVEFILTDYYFSGDCTLTGLEFAKQAKELIPLPIYLSTNLDVAEEDLSYVDGTVPKKPKRLT